MLANQYYVVDMPDGSRWAVPICVIALDRARHYQSEYNNNVIRSLEMDTRPLFEAQPEAIAEWARDNMDWEEVEPTAIQLRPPGTVDYQYGWTNGRWAIVDEAEVGDQQVT